MNDRLLVSRSRLLMFVEMISSVNLNRLVMSYMLAIIRSGTMLTVLGRVLWHSLRGISWYVLDW